MKNIMPFIDKTLLESKDETFLLREIIQRYYEESGYEKLGKITSLREKTLNMTSAAAKTLRIDHTDKYTLFKAMDNKIAPWFIKLKSTK